MDLRKTKNYGGINSNPYVTADRLAILTNTATTNNETATPSIIQDLNSIEQSKIYTQRTEEYSPTLVDKKRVNQVSFMNSKREMQTKKLSIASAQEENSVQKILIADDLNSDRSSFQKLKVGEKELDGFGS